MEEKPADQMSESVLLGVLLMLAGGFLDAYSYLCRGGVFANAQTGNIVLLGISLAQQNWMLALQYLLPVIVFAVGVFIAEKLKWQLRKQKQIHWRQIILLIEIVIIFFTAFLDSSLNWLANSMISFACALQVESFRKIRGNACATTMCTGNLRSAAEWMCRYQRVGDDALRKKSNIYSFFIIVFMLGALLGGFCSRILFHKASLLALLPLVVCFFLMFQEKDVFALTKHRF